MQQATFWDGRAAKYDEDIRTHDSLYIRTITGTTSLLTNSDTVLDLGCGSEEIGLDIARHVQRVHGIDVSTKMIELANQKAHDRSVSNVEFSKADVFDRMLGDAFDRMLAEGSFSAVTAFNVFHLVDDIHACWLDYVTCLNREDYWFHRLRASASGIGLSGGIVKLAKIPLTDPQHARFTTGRDERWTPSFGQVFVTAKVESGFMIQATLG